jgi:hypothetical protein
MRARWQAVRTLLAVTAISAAAAGLAHAQSLATEVDVTTGYSSEDNVKAVAAQLRLFGDVTSGIRFNVEGTWARRSGLEGDQFGAAYPYGDRVELSEAYAERTFQRGKGLIGVRAGQYRTPFGISARSDYAYGGFLRAPLLRYDGYWALTNDFLERGVDVVVGTPRLSVEASLGVPADIGPNHARRRGLDRVFRVQGYVQDLVLGVSHINSEPNAPSYAKGRLAFTGIDGRWTRSGIQLRGEWIIGQAWDNTATNAWYVDAIVHRRFMGPVTAVFRSEQLNFTSVRPFEYRGTAGVTTWLGRRHTAGGRVRLPGGLTAQLNVISQSDWLSQYGGTAVDLALTYSIRVD